MPEAHNTVCTLQWSSVGAISVGNTRKIMISVSVLQGSYSLGVDTTVLESLRASILDYSDAWSGYGS
jgi:hypothetical protein